MNVDGTGTRARLLKGSTYEERRHGRRMDNGWRSRSIGTASRSVKIPLGGGGPVPLVNQYSADPTWSPNGQFIVYLERVSGRTFPMKAIMRMACPATFQACYRRGAPGGSCFWGRRQTRFMKGDISHKDF